MKTFSIQTLGCKVNHYESEQIARLLTLSGLTQAEPTVADLRVVNTCSVTTAAARQSRQSVRRVVRLPMLSASAEAQNSQGSNADPSIFAPNPAKLSRILVTGCWATSDREAALAITGVDAVIGHHQDVAGELDRLLKTWQREDQQAASAACQPITPESITLESLPGPDSLNEFAIGWIKQAGTTASKLTGDIKPLQALQVNENLDKSQGKIDHHGDTEARRRFRTAAAHRPNHAFSISMATDSDIASNTESASVSPCLRGEPSFAGTRHLPLLEGRQENRQRAYLKIQDGCDAHCTYCIIPTLRPRLWSKPVREAVDEAKALVDAGHVEIVLTGIFLGAYNQPTALRRRQPQATGKPLAELLDALCTQVFGLKRLRLSSLEPGDLNAELLATLRSHPQVVPHFHLPLQSGSDLILRRMNRQYTRGDFLEMVERLNSTFDRPALTTDIVVGFPGEDDAEFEETAEVVRRAGFIYVHAFPYSPRPGTAAARWTDQFIHGPVVNWRIEHLQSLAATQSFRFRQSFLNQVVEVVTERDPDARFRHGRCERYFDVSFDDPTAKPGDARTLRITRVTDNSTFGELEGL